jgi:DNA-binding Xre family transcriptional regulator
VFIPMEPDIDTRLRAWLNRTMQARGNMTGSHLEMLSGYDSGALSKWLNNKVQHITLRTVMRLCQGLSVSLADLLPDLQDMRIPILEERAAAVSPPPSLSGSDLERLVYCARLDRGGLCSWLAGKITEVEAAGAIAQAAVRSGCAVPACTPSQLEWLSSGEFLVFQVAVRYPPVTPSGTILDLYREGGVVTFCDLARALDTSWRTSGLQQFKCRGLARRLVEGKERITMREITDLDEDGTLLALFWEAFRYNEWHTHGTACSTGRTDDHTRLAPATSSERFLVDLLVSVCRWHAFFAGRAQREWIARMRQDLAMLAPSP